MTALSSERNLPAGRSSGHGISSRRRLTVAALAGALAAVPVAMVAPWEFTPLTLWDVTAAVFVTWVWLTITRLDAECTARFAVREDPTRTATDSLLLVAAVVSLVAVGLVVMRASSRHGVMEAAQVALGVASVVLSWVVVHTVFTLRYARLYYTDPDGGVSFNGDEPPSYIDFAYLAFTIGMTFQVSDTDIETHEMRATALRQALLSYLFGTVIIAGTINLLAGLRK